MTKSWKKRELPQSRKFLQRVEPYGYKPQSVIDALNLVVGANGWGYKVVEHSINKVENKKGETRYLAWVKKRSGSG